jgi:large-conductance mechanosensitive channel
MTVSATLLVFTVSASAATAPESPSPKEIVAGLVPFLIIVGLLLWTLRRQQKRTNPILDKEVEHMDVVQEQNAQIITLLKEIRDLMPKKKSETTPQQPPPLE